MKNVFQKSFLALMAVLLCTQAAMAARTELTIKNPPVLTTYPIAADSADIAFVAGTATDGFQFVSTGREILLIKNVNAGAQTVTVKSVADGLGRSGDNPAAYSLAQNEIGVFGPYPPTGWRQSDNKIYVDVGHNDIQAVVIRLPAF